MLKIHEKVSGKCYVPALFWGKSVEKNVHFAVILAENL